MKKLSVSTFYTMQGLGNLILGFYTRVDGSYGAPGGGLAGLENTIRSVLFFASCLSLVTALVLSLRLEDWALPLGEITSVFFGLFYGYLLILQAPITVVVRLLSLLIVVLNAVSVFFLYDLSKNKSIPD